MTSAPGDPFAVAPLELSPSRQVRNAPGTRTRTRSDNRTGRYVRATPTPPATPDLALDATLRAAAPYQSVRAKGNLALAIAEPDLRHKVRERKNRPPYPPGGGRCPAPWAPMSACGRPRPPSCRCCSTPISAGSGWGLVVFQGEKAVTALPFTHSLEMAQRYLRDLPTGGKTPLPHGLAQALDLITRERGKHPKDAFLLVLITDGKANISLTGQPPMTEVRDLATRIKGLGINALVLNTEALCPLPGRGQPAGDQPADGRGL